jgi:hypothetical protein
VAGKESLVSLVPIPNANKGRDGCAIKTFRAAAAALAYTDYNVCEWCNRCCAAEQTIEAKLRMEIYIGISYTNSHVFPLK